VKLIRSPRAGDMLDARNTMYPSLLEVVEGEVERPALPNHTFGYVLEGQADLHTRYGAALLMAGAYFAVPGDFGLQAAGKVVLITRFGYRGQFVVGSIEERGRLSYIDGCSDSMLVYPPRQGDPVFNHLHFPAGIRQTQHTHPSIRLGIVARGAGVAWGPWTPAASGPDETREADELRLKELGMWTETIDGRPYWNLPLSPGCVFLLEEQEMHSFRTDGATRPVVTREHPSGSVRSIPQTTVNASTMDVVAFHPDSDWGPTDAAHPMLNRTYLNARATGT
jgi:hypothetical protein